MKFRLIFASAIILGLAATTIVSCTSNPQNKIEGEDAANAESVVGATDNVPVIEESAAQIAPAAAQVDQ